METKKIVLGISAGILTLFTACSSTPKETSGETPVKVVVYNPTKVVGGSIQISGQVASKQTATISTRMMGYVQKIHVKPGDKVQAGQQLITINGNDIQAKKQQVIAMLTEAQAAEQNAKKDYERFQVLHQQNSVSDKEFENVTLQYTSMRSKLQMAQEALNEIDVQLSYSNITAPFAGTVTRKMIDEGSMANPGMPLLVVEQAGSFLIEAAIPETYIQYIKLGDEATIDVKSANQTLRGKIIELSPSAYGTGGQYLMKIAPTENMDKSIRSGMFATLTIVTGGSNQTGNDRLLIDNRSIVNRDQLTGVYLVDSNNQAILKWVRLGKNNGTEAEVFSGLNPEDQIIKEAEGKLYNGKKVTITNK